MIFNIAIFLFALFYLYLSWKRLDWAVLLLVVALPSYLIRFNVGIPMTLLELMILIAFFVWLITKTNFKLFLRGKYDWKDFKENRLKRERYPWRWEISFLLLFSWSAIAVAGFTDGALGIWKAYFFEPILVFILILNLFKQDLSFRTDSPASGEVRNPLNFKTDLKGSLAGARDDKKNVGLNIEKIILALAISAFFVSLLSIYQKITGDLISNPLWAAAETRRVVSFFGYPNAVGLYLGPIVMILLGYLSDVILKPKAEKSQVQLDKTSSPSDQRFFARWAQNDNVKKVFIGSTIVLSLLSIYFAKSEGALVGLAAALFVFGILAGKKMRWATLAFTIVVSSAVLLYAPTRTVVLDKVQLYDLSGQIRRQQWKETWRMLNDGRLLSGAGLDNYQAIIKPYHQEGIFVYDFHDPNFHEKLVASDELKKKVWQPTEIYMYPHNILLNFWSGLGLVGMLLFVWIFIKFFWVLISNLIIEKRYFCHPRESGDLEPTCNKNEIPACAGMTRRYFINLGLLCAMIVIVIHGLVDVPYFKNDLSVMFWIMVAMQSLINLQTKNKEI